MNHFVTFCLVAAAFAVVQAGPKPDPRVAAVVEKCVASEKLTPDDVTAVQKYSLDLSKEAKCFIGCFMKEFNWMTADGKIQRDVFMAHAEAETKGDAAQMKIAAEMFDNCSSKAGGGDPCESAFGWASCMMTEMTARNIPLDSLFL